MRYSSHHRPMLFQVLPLLILASIFLSACASQSVAGVATEAPPTPGSTDTPVPTSTATNTSTPEPTGTPTPTATFTPTATPNRTATISVIKTATQVAIDGRVSAELTNLGLDPGLGHVAWVMDKAMELDGGGYAQGWYQPIQELGVLKDFVVQSEVTWDTSGGLAGCAYIFRAPDDWDLEIGDYYDFSFIRLQFEPTWFISYVKDGRWQYALPSNVGVVSPNLEDDKFSKNTITLDARGDTFTIYVNGVKERSIQNNKIGEGRLAFEVVQNSGTSYCMFDKAWVWVYDE